MFHRFLTLAAVAMPVLAARYSMEFNPADTRIQWTLSDVLHTVVGTFDLKHGNIDFDPETGGASGQVTVDVASGNSGNQVRDRRMHASVLESSKYSEAIFVPDRIQGEIVVPWTSNFRLHGILTIHGASHEMTVDVQMTATSNQVNATIRFEVPYVAWGMNDPSNFLLKVGKTVQVSMRTSGVLQKH